MPLAMSLDDPVILTCAISGAVANRDQCPAIPYTPDEYGAEARRIVDGHGLLRQRVGRSTPHFGAPRGKWQGIEPPTRG